MEHILNQTDLLKVLLGRFVNLMYVNDEELERMHDFIFCTRPVSEAIMEDKSEIYETLDFLKDLAEDNNLTSVTDLLRYFDNQIELSDAIITEERNRLPLFNEEFMTHDFLVQKLHEELSKQARIQFLENHYINVMPKFLRPVNILYGCGDRLQMLPNTDDIHFENYYKAFAPQRELYPKVISFLKKLKGFFSVAVKKRVRKERIKVKQLYRQIYDCIEKEQPIENEQMRLMLSKIMLIAKYNNPEFRTKQLTLKEGKGRSDNKESKSDFAVSKKYYQYLTQKQWTVLKSPQGSSWNTTDNPGFSIDMNAVTEMNQIVPDPYWTDVSTNSLIYFPLSDQYCLRLVPGNDSPVEPQETRIDFMHCTLEELNVVNKLSLASHPQVLISPLHGIKKRTEGQHCEMTY
jgi:hypothetical protein